MKRRPTTSQQTSIQPSEPSIDSKPDPKSELMSRLAKGGKVSVPKEEMLKLT